MGWTTYASNFRTFYGPRLILGRGP